MNNFFNSKIDPKLENLIKLEEKRQVEHVELIASENYTSPNVLKITGSQLTNKYAEGYPHKRYYDGCEEIDKIENLAIEYLKKLFECSCDSKTCKKANGHANVQPHSGSQANTAAYYAVLKPGDTYLALSLSDGGHLTHGHKVNFSGRFYNAIHYHVDKKNEEIDFTEIRNLALKHKPKLIVCGASSYSKEINFKKFREIADECGALLMADVAHIAGLIVAGLHQNPTCYVDIITSTTHKTLRGPRSGIILCTKELAKKIDHAVFPGNQGGPLEHVIAAKAQAFYEALQPSFKEYQMQIIKNTKAFAEVFKNLGFHVVANGTENHLFMINVKNTLNITGKEAIEILNKINVIANKNMVPFDTESPFITSGVRFGTPAMTTRGFKEKEFIKLGNYIVEAWKNHKDEAKIQEIKNNIIEMLSHFKIY